MRACLGLYDIFLPISILKCGISFVLGFPTRSAGVGTLIYACTLDSYREVSCHNNYDAFIIEYTTQGFCC